jgi:hypothetical protein
VLQGCCADDKQFARLPKVCAAVQVRVGPQISLKDRV